MRMLPQLKQTYTMTMKENHAKHVFKKKKSISFGDYPWGHDNHRKLNQVKDEFISLLAHELLSPLTSIMCISEILRDTDDLKPCERRHFVDIIIHESERLNCLIDQVLCILKWDNSKGGTPWTKTD